MTTRLRLAVPAFTLVSFAALAPVAAQRAELPPRLGFEGGFGLYGGEINCEDQSGASCGGFNEAGGIDGHLTYMFRPALGVTFDVFPMFHTEDNWTFTHNVVTVGLKWRPVPIVGVTVGVGSAQASLHYDGLVQLDQRSDTGGALLLAAGVDVVRGRGFAIDVEVRAGFGFYGDDDNDGQADIVARNFGVGAAVTWF